MSPSVDIYYHPFSTPSRAVLMTATNLGVPINQKLTNIFVGENRTPQFLKMNPQHTVPTMDDNGFYLYESRAILQYLANAYSKNDSFYPKDAKKRAIVDQRLQFDQGTLYKSFMDAYGGVIFNKSKFDPEAVAKYDAALELLSSYVTFTNYVAGNELTIADFSIMAGLSTAEACDHDISKHPQVVKYMDRCKKAIKGYNDVNQEGATGFGEFAKPLLKKAKA